MKLRVSDVILNGTQKLDDYKVQARGSWFMNKKIGDKYRYNSFLSDYTGVEIFPGVFQGTYEYNKSVVELLTKIERELGSHRSNSYTGLGNCMQDWTVGSYPLNLPLTHVGEYREAQGLAPKASPEYLEHVEEVFRMMRDMMNFSSLKIKKKSQSGSPLFVAGQDKAKLLYYSFNNVNSIVKGYVDDDLTSLLNLKALGVYAPNVRMQSSSVNYELVGNSLEISAKDKYVINPEYSLWQFGLLETKPDVSTLLDMNHPRPERSCGLLAARQRMIWSLNYIVNVFYQIVDGFIQSAFHKMALTHISGHTDMYNEFGDKKHFAAWDFSSYDTTQGADVVEIFFRIFIDEVFTEDFAIMLRKLYRSPALLPSYKANERADLVLGEPFTGSLDGGMLSGIAIVASMGKAMSVAFYTYMMKQFTNDSIEDILHGRQSDVYGKVFSDDKINGWKVARWRDKWVEFINKRIERGEAYYMLKWEEYPRFLGPIYGEDRPHLNLSKLIEGLTMIERPYTTKPAYFAGIADKLQQYSSEPEFEVIYPLLYEHFLKFDLDLNYINAYNVASGKSYSYEELEFLNNPDVIFYKYAPDYFPKELIEAFFTTVPLEVVKTVIEPYVKNLYKER